MKLSVLQWNVWYKEDNQRISEFLKTQQADVICLQELTIEAEQGIKHAPDYIAKQLGYRYFYKEIDLGEGKITLANGIFSRFPIRGSRFVWINEPTGLGGYDDEYRAYVEVTLDVDGQEVTVGTVHMSYTHRFEGTARKRQETDRLLGEIANQKFRYIFTGDLNAVPGSYTIESISKQLTNAGPDLDQNTWTTKPFSYNGFEETELNWRLDHIFTTPDIKVAHSEVLQTEYSDHLPVRAVVEI